jgi:hypothetical protein
MLTKKVTWENKVFSSNLLATFEHLLCHKQLQKELLTQGKNLKGNKILFPK